VSWSRYDALMTVLRDGRQITEVASLYGVPRQSVHTWMGRYQVGGIAALADRSHRPRACPHQMDRARKPDASSFATSTRAGGPRRL
jgi:transposase